MAEEVAASPAVETPTETAVFPENAEAPAPVEPTGQEKEESPASSESESQDESVKASDASNQERSDREQRASETAKRQAMEIRDLKRQLKAIAQQQQQTQPRMAQPPQKPKIEDYDDIARFNDDLEKWSKADREFAIQQHETRRQQEEAKKAAEKQAAEIKAAFEKRSQRILKTNPDFNVKEAIERIEPSPTMDGFFADSEAGPELVDYFDANPDEADKFRAMAPFAAVRELVKLEDKLLNQIKGIKAKPALVKPPGTVQGRASAPAAPKTAADILYG